ncbi:hypothetical protein DFP73DRAFT_603590 [Morchella snyderi]|nr:hypothetical protein DFP73DRAFT_603590 [Morchella snyderi]
MAQINKVLVVGAGIAGLSIAIALRKRGVVVEIFERTPELSEAGAAISLTPNSTCFLLSFGFDPKCARATNAGPQYEYNKDGIIVDSLDLRDIVRDLGPPARLRLGFNIICVDCDSGVIVSDKGETFQGNLIIGAGGVKLAVRQEVTGRREEPSVYSGHSAFRSLYNIEELKTDPELRVFVNEIKMDDWRLLYPCRDNTLLNLFAPEFCEASQSVESWRANGKASDLDEMFKESPKPLQKLLLKDPSPRLWQIRIAILTKLAQRQCTYQGQGGAQAIEDAASLPIFLLDTPSDISLSDRLQRFEEFRYPRVTAIQDRSRKQKQGPKQREGKLPSIEMWPQIDKRVSYDVVGEAKSAVL